jgi:hypothetical protein
MPFQKSIYLFKDKNNNVKYNMNGRWDSHLDVTNV